MLIHTDRIRCSHMSHVDKLYDAIRCRHRLQVSACTPPVTAARAAPHKISPRLAPYLRWGTRRTNVKITEKPYDHMNTPAPLYGLCCLLSVSPSVHSGRSPCQPTLCSPRRSAHHDTLLLPPSPLSAMMSARDWRLRPSWRRRRFRRGCRSTSIRLQIRKLLASKLGSYSHPN